MNCLAPVLISAYNRPNHLKKCISSLAANPEAVNTPLFLAIDAPYRDEDFDANREVISLCENISGFNKVEIIKRKTNLGSRNNMTLALKHIFQIYTVAIISEDDNIFSPVFLKYMNDGLLGYKDNQKIFSVCGYSYPVDTPKGYIGDTYFAKAFSGWGVGYWRDKYIHVDFNTASFWRLFLNPLTFHKFNLSMGDHIFAHLLSSKIRNAIYGDTAISLHMFNHDMLSVFPVKTLALNIGCDGSGVHSGVNLLINRQILSSKIVDHSSNTECIENKEYRIILNKYFKMSLGRKCVGYFLYLILSIINGSKTHYAKSLDKHCKILLNKLINFYKKTSC